MVPSSYSATEQTTNTNRVSRLLMGPCTDQLQDLLRSYIDPSTFPAIIKQKKSRLPRLPDSQKNLILPKTGFYTGNYKDLDITMLYVLFRNISGITEHNNGWGEDPEPTDRYVSANIERMRMARNQCGHSTSAALSNAEFNQIWSTIRATVVDLDLALNNGHKYEKVVDFIRHDTMDPVRDKHYRDLLLKQTAEYQTTVNEINLLKRHVEENDEQVQQKMRKLEGSLQVIKTQNTFVHDYLEEAKEKMSSLDERTIPLHIRKQHVQLLESWRKDDKPFHEIQFSRHHGKSKIPANGDHHWRAWIRENGDYRPHRTSLTN